MNTRLIRSTKTLSLLLLSGAAVYSILWIIGPRRPYDVRDGDPDLLTYQMEIPSTRSQISPQTAYDRFAPQASTSCEAICQKDKNPACRAKTFKEWDKLLAGDKIEGVPLFNDDEYVFPFEKEYLSLPPLVDLKKLPNLKKSVIYHVDKKGQSKIKSQVKCQYLDKLSFRVDFVDGYGNPRTRGGDEVRVWITGNPKNRSAHDFALAGFVHDFYNGSYLATVTCAWTGHATLKIGLAYPWEYIRAALYNFQHGVHVFVAGIFKRDSVEEYTICQSHPNVPGRPCLCNMTHWNLLPFFCGRPLDERLSCSDIIGTISMPNVPRLLYTPAEKVMSDAMTREASKMIVQHQVNISVIDEGGRKLPRKPCSQVNKALTWQFKPPRGFWSTENTWTSLMCKQHEFSIPWVQKCLRDTTVWIFGDSNAKQIYKALRRWIPCSGAGQPHHALPFCYEKEDRINMTYVVHENTVYSNKTRTMPSQSHVGLRQYVDLIPETGRHFVFFHYFLHPARAHPSALYFRLRSLKRLIVKLLRRNPNVHIAVRGPHISTMQVLRNHMLGGDVLGYFAKVLYLETFRDLRDKIMFLDGWDMTVAIRNPSYHPIPQVADELTRTFLAFKCD